MISPYLSGIGPYIGYGWVRIKDSRFICNKCNRLLTAKDRIFATKWFFRTHTSDTLKAFVEFQHQMYPDELSLEPCKYGYKIKMKKCI